MNRRQVPTELLVFLGLLFAGFLLGKLQTSYRDKGKFDPVTRAVSWAAKPAASSLSAFGAGVNNFIWGLGHAAALREENRQLRAEIQGLSHSQDQISLLQNEVKQLQNLSGFPAQLESEKAAAFIISIFPSENRLTINIGSDHGVKPNMPVVNGQGLLGIVQTVTSHESQVVLLTSPTTQVGAIALRSPPSVGIIRGEDPSTLVLDLVDPKSSVQVGDDVTTSGLSDYIPRGIPIGRVIRIQDNPDFGTRRAYIFPWASLGAGREVFVIK